MEFFFSKLFSDFDKRVCNAHFCSDQFQKSAELEIEAYPLLDELTSKISTLNLERVRRLKSRLVALTRRVQKVMLIYSFFLHGCK